MIPTSPAAQNLNEFSFVTRINGVETTSLEGLVCSTAGDTVTAGTPVTIQYSMGQAAWTLSEVQGCGGVLTGSGPWTYTFVMPSNNCTVDAFTFGVEQIGCSTVNNGVGKNQGNANIGAPLVRIRGGSTGPFSLQTTNTGSSVSPPSAGIGIVPGSVQYLPDQNQTSLLWTAVNGSQGSVQFGVAYRVTATDLSTGAQAILQNDVACSTPFAWDNTPQAVQGQVLKSRPSIGVINIVTGANTRWREGRIFRAADGVPPYSWSVSILGCDTDITQNGISIQVDPDNPNGFGSDNRFLQLFFESDNFDPGTPLNSPAISQNCSAILTVTDSDSPPQQTSAALSAGAAHGTII